MTRAAAYARYSSDQQRPESIRDQLRRCADYAAAQGWGEPAAYTDEAISGSVRERPGYQRLLADAEARRIDVVLVDALSRLSRDSIESQRILRLLRFWGVRLVAISDGIDTEQRGYKVNGGLRGLMNELYLDELASSTHRGLEGQARAGYSAGGLPYGYRSIDTTDGHRREIDATQAEHVRWIFERYAAGDSPRAIAADLNRRRVPSPRGGAWSQTAIYGDARRGLGILNNAIYTGLQIWNRSHWVKDPDTGVRKRRERPEAEWIITDHPELRIVDQCTWDAVKARQKATRQKTRRLQEACGKNARQGRGPRYILSGLLVCGECGGSMVVVDRYRYGCARHKDRGAEVCGQSAKVARRAAEQRILATVKDELLGEDAYQAFAAEVRRLLREERPDPAAARQALRKAERERDNILAAIRQGIITPTTRQAMEDAEAAVIEAQAELAALEAYQPDQILPRMREVYRRLVAQLEEIDDVPAAREALRELVGQIRVVVEGGEVYAEMNSAGTEAGAESQIRLVAGARFCPYLTAPLRVRLAKAGKGTA